MALNYVSKADLKPYSKEFNEAIKYVRTKIEDFTFQYRLIGSAKRNLVMKHHNKGIDLDYQIIFQKSIKGLLPNEYKNIKNMFITAFNDYFVSRGYKYSEDSMSAITIKKVDKSSILNSYDVTLISKEADGLYIIRYDTEEKQVLTLKKMRNSYIFMTRYKEIKGQEMWQELRDLYKTKKSNNIDNKKSFSLLAEAVKELFD